jgi:hypothetical protein
MNYSDMTKAVIDAIKGDINSNHKWKAAGAQVVQYFGTEQALRDAKAQFIADTILPAIEKRHVDALKVDLPRKGSKEYKALDASGVAKWETANRAKIDARSTADTYFTRVVKYAFPAEKTESTTPESEKTQETKILEVVNSIIGKMEKGESLNFDLIEALHLARKLATVVATPKA